MAYGKESSAKSGSDKKFEKKRKGPRLVDVEEGEVFEAKVFDELLEHAKNSGLWYAGSSTKTSQQIREKLYEKGYPHEEVYRESEGKQTLRNFVEETIDYLNESLMLNDQAYAESFALSRLAQKKGRSRTKMDLMFKGIPSDMADEALDSVYSDSHDELYELVEKLWLQEEKRGSEPFKVKQKVFQKVASRGWGFGEIGEAIEELMEKREDEEEQRESSH